MSDTPIGLSRPSRNIRPALACVLALTALAAQPAPPVVPEPPNRSTATPSAAGCRGAAAGQTGGLEARPLPYDARLVVFPFDRNALFQVNALFNRYTHFELEPGEKVVGAYLNDETEWEMRVAATGSDILVRPRQREVTGSLSVITDRRRYQMELQEISGCAGAQRYQRVSWVYSEGVYEDRAAAERLENPRRPSPLADGPLRPPPDTLSVSVERLNLDYDIEGDPHLKPVAVFDDGVRTVFKFAAGVDLRPVLLAVGADGEAEVVDYSVQGRHFIAQRVFAHGVLLKLGKQEARVRNRASRCRWFDTSCRRVTAANVGGGL